MTSKTKPIPEIVKLGAWFLSLFVFAVGFWHTHLGLKEMKPFGSEWGGLVIASIVLLLLLITYWFAVNGRKMALIFYILCGAVFFICNLNYFYPAYMARTLIQNEAKALVDTLDHYSNEKLNTSDNSEEIGELSNLNFYKSNILSEIKSHGFGPNARELTMKFNSILAKYSIAPVPVNATYAKVTDDPAEIEYQLNEFSKSLKQAIDSYYAKGILKLINPDQFQKGMDTLYLIAAEYKNKLQKVATDNETVYKLDTIDKYENVKTIVSFVTKLNGCIDQINKGNNPEKPILKSLDPDTHPRADKLGKIKYTMLSIKERKKEIDTWAIIILCLFIDLIVPLAIYLLLRKKGDEEETKTPKWEDRTW